MRRDREQAIIYTGWEERTNYITMDEEGEHCQAIIIIKINGWGEIICYHNGEEKDQAVIYTGWEERTSFYNGQGERTSYYNELGERIRYHNGWGERASNYM